MQRINSNRLLLLCLSTTSTYAIQSDSIVQTISADILCVVSTTQRRYRSVTRNGSAGSQAHQHPTFPYIQLRLRWRLLSKRIYVLPNQSIFVGVDDAAVVVVVRRDLLLVVEPNEIKWSWTQLCVWITKTWYHLHHSNVEQKLSRCRRRLRLFLFQYFFFRSGTSVPFEIWNKKFCSIVATMAPTSSTFFSILSLSLSRSLCTSFIFCISFHWWMRIRITERDRPNDIAVLRISFPSVRCSTEANANMRLYLLPLNIYTHRQSPLLSQRSLSFRTAINFKISNMLDSPLHLLPFLFSLSLSHTITDARSLMWSSSSQLFVQFMLLQNRMQLPVHNLLLPYTTTTYYQTTVVPFAHFITISNKVSGRMPVCVCGDERRRKQEKRWRGHGTSVGERVCACLFVFTAYFWLYFQSLHSFVVQFRVLPVGILLVFLSSVPFCFGIFDCYMCVCLLCRLSTIDMQPYTESNCHCHCDWYVPNWMPPSHELSFIFYPLPARIVCLAVGVVDGAVNTHCNVIRIDKVKTHSIRFSRNRNEDISSQTKDDKTKLSTGNGSKPNH